MISNAFQDRLVVTASICLRNFNFKKAAQFFDLNDCGTKLYFLICNTVTAYCSACVYFNRTTLFCQRCGAGCRV
ncbi:MAG TPA: hypothetical protein DHG49_03665 [Clostridiales bacterium]|nr:MAG: hypothetical protein DBY28_01080 [Subdoligranulum sp.]HCW81817.1 hypothetical protein [Clostridiales bacterium]